jgi:hypothetical protein
VAAVVAGAAVVVAATAAAPAPIVAVATSNTLKVLFNFMTAFLNCCKRLLKRAVNTCVTLYKAFQHYNG